MCLACTPQTPEFFPCQAASWRSITPRVWSNKEKGKNQPNSFGFLVAKPCKTAKFFNPLNVFPMSPVNVTAPFLVQKALKTANSEKCVFCVRRQKCSLGLQIRSFSAENLLQVFAVLRNPYSASKNLRIPARRACHRRSHRSLTRQPAEAQPRVSQCLTRQPAEVHVSPPRLFHVTRQPAELVTAEVTGL